MTKKLGRMTNEKAALGDRLCILETDNVFLNERLAEFEIRVISLESRVVEIERAAANRIAMLEDKYFDLNRRYEYVAYPWTRTDATGCDIKIYR